MKRDFRIRSGTKHLPPQTIFLIVFRHEDEDNLVPTSNFLARVDKSFVLFCPSSRTPSHHIRRRYCTQYTSSNSTRATLTNSQVRLSKNFPKMKLSLLAAILLFSPAISASTSTLRDTVRETKSHSPQADSASSNSLQLSNDATLHSTLTEEQKR